MLRGKTLRMRITLLTMLVLALVTFSSTLVSILIARQQFVVPVESLGVDMNYIEIIPRTTDVDIAAMTPFTYGIAEVRNPAQASHANFQIYSIIATIALTLIGTTIAYIISGQTLKPIKLLVKKVEAIDENNLTTRVSLPESNDEISSLTRSFNSMLEKLNHGFDAQRLFAQNAAHELKTPLASMRANIEVLQIDEKPTTEEYAEVIKIVKGNIEQLIGIVEGLLHLNNVASEVEWQSFESRDVFERVVDELHPEIQQKRINVEILGECRIRGDKSLLSRAFSNLIHNAVRYNNENGSVKISLSESGIIIEDSGVGIPSEHLPRVFEPFYCVDRSRSKKLGGHGLGMSIAKSIFDRHRIEIRILSEQRVGTKIFLNI